MNTPTAHFVADSSPARTDNYKKEYVGDFLSRWDELIGWDARRASEGSFFIDMLRDSDARYVLDAAAGTGYHAIELARAGFDVVASDGAAGMIARARENAKVHGMEVPFHVCDWRDLTKVIARRFDAVLCLGNSISHIFAESDRVVVLRQFYEMLSSGGALLIDHRNYDSLLDGVARERRQSYCCCGGGASVSLHRTELGSVRIVYQLGSEARHEIETYPLRRLEMTKALESAGFSEVSTYGDFRLDFSPHEADFFIYVARRLRT